jgi:hypothetical protein
MSIYTYSISGDFGGVVPDHRQLIEDIRSNTTITSVVSGMMINEELDQIQFGFTTALSGGEETELTTNIVGSHTNTNEHQKQSSFKYYPRVREVESVSWHSIGNFFYAGEATKGVVNQIECITYMANGAQNYSIQIVNKDTNTIVVENTFTNTTPECNILTPISNISRKGVMYEVSIKVNKNNKKVYIDEIEIWHDNTFY